MKSSQIYRAKWHDYRSRCIYMITINKRDRIPDFGILSGDWSLPVGAPGCSFVAQTVLGKIIRNAIFNLPKIEPAIKILQYSVMPDHIHVLLFVQRPITEPIGFAIARFKNEVNKTFGMTGIFEDGFNDQILKSSRSLDVIFNYIRENPYRLAVRRANPEFFKRVNRLEIAGRFYQAYGNIHLLQNPFKEQVVVHRADSPETRELNRELWLYTAANGGVLVSPFISAAEKAIRSEADELRGKVILLRHESLPDRFKPEARNFELCCEGKLLIIAPEGCPEPLPLTRQVCVNMNSLAESIVGGREIGKSGIF